MDKSIIQQIWPEWTPEEKIGGGSYGEVYKCVKNALGSPVYAAIKVITVPGDDNAVAELKTAGLDDKAIHAYFKKIVDGCVEEIRLLDALKGAPNVVNLEDFTVVQRKDAFGWVICIRMELLENLPRHLGGRQMAEEDVIRLGIDVCTALEACHTRHIIHRDIKPSNIMVSPYGGYKLGDFGIARNLEKGNSALSNKGNFAYKAPEVETRDNYDMRVDIYSLGLTMYQLLNNGRPPFVDPYKETVTYEDREEAIRRRYIGDAFPPAANAGPALTEVLNKACAFDPARRYGSATIMKQALQALKKGDKKDMDNSRYGEGARPNNQAGSGSWNEADRHEQRTTVYGGGRAGEPDDFDRTMVAGSGYGSVPQERRPSGGQNRERDWQDGYNRDRRNYDDGPRHSRGEMPQFEEPPMPVSNNRNDDYLADISSAGVSKKKVVVLGVIAAILIAGLAAASVFLGLQLKDEKAKNDEDSEFCILTQPESIKTVDGETVFFSVEVKGDDVTYQWEQKSDGKWEKIKKDGDERVLELVASEENEDTEYRCKVTNTKAADDEDEDDDDDEEKEELYTKTVKLTLGEGIKITGQPKDVTAVLGEEITFTVEAEADENQDDITYQWEKLVDGVWERLGSAYEEATLTFKPNEKHANAEYRCRVISADGVTVFSDSATITLNP